MRLLVVGFIIVIVFIICFSRTEKPEDVWKRYKLDPIKSEELDDWMKALNIYREAYETNEYIPNKVALRLGIENTRKSILDWYKNKAEELGLDSTTAENFSRDVIRHEKI